MSTFLLNSLIRWQTEISWADCWDTPPVTASSKKISTITLLIIYRYLARPTNLCNLIPEQPTMQNLIKGLADVHIDYDYNPALIDFLCYFFEKLSTLFNCACLNVSYM